MYDKEEKYIVYEDGSFDIFPCGGDSHSSVARRSGKKAYHAGFLYEYEGKKWTSGMSLTLNIKSSPDDIKILFPSH